MGKLMEKQTSGLRTILICLIMMHGFWLIISALNIVSISIYEIIPPVVYSLMTVISNTIEIVFYVLLLGILPALAKRD
jgi:hypothetical protein